MATTRLIPLHKVNTKSTLQTLKDRTDYVMNPEKTENGKYITTYKCDPRTINEEFLLAKVQYDRKTGREEDKKAVIAYQLRQSFKPGEVTPEEANQIGYDLAYQFTKGKHAFVVATHVDKPHIHNHIIFNSTNLDSTGKFRNFYLSFKTVQRISDQLCVMHGLSVIDEPKPYREREKREPYEMKDTFRNRICGDIDKALEQKPDSFEALLRMLEKMGYEVKRKKHTAVKGEGQKRFIRFDSLGAGYSDDELHLTILGLHDHQPGRKNRARREEQPVIRLKVLIDVEAKVREGKGTGYIRWAKVFNVKQMAEAICFMKEHGFNTIDELDEKVKEVTAKYSSLLDTIKNAEKQMKDIQRLENAIINYGKTKAVYSDYIKSGRSGKFYEEHQAEITQHEAAREVYASLKGRKMPPMKDLKAAHAKLKAERSAAYDEYKAAKKDNQDFLTAQKIIKTILNEDPNEEMQKDKSGGAETGERKTSRGTEEPERSRKEKQSSGKDL